MFWNFPLEMESVFKDLSSLLLNIIQQANIFAKYFLILVHYIYLLFQAIIICKINTIQSYFQ